MASAVETSQEVFPAKTNGYFSGNEDSADDRSKSPTPVRNGVDKQSVQEDNCAKDETEVKKMVSDESDTQVKASDDIEAEKETENTEEEVQVNGVAEGHQEDSNITEDKVNGVEDPLEEDGKEAVDDTSETEDKQVKSDSGDLPQSSKEDTEQDSSAIVENGDIKAETDDTGKDITDENETDVDSGKLEASMEIEDTNEELKDESMEIKDESMQVSDESLTKDEGDEKEKDEDASKDEKMESKEEESEIKKTDKPTEDAKEEQKEDSTDKAKTVPPTKPSDKGNDDDEIMEVGTKPAPPKMVTMMFVNESIVEPRNEISFEPVDSNDTDDDDDEDPDEASAVSAGISDEEEARLKKERADLKALKDKQKEVTTIHENSRVDNDRVDYEEAEAFLNKIDEENKRSVEDTGDKMKKKRPAVTITPIEPASKKQKTDAEEPEASTATKKAKKKLKKMTRRSLENIILENIVTIMASTSEIGALRRQVDAYKAAAALWQAKEESLSKQVKDLSTVMRKFILERSKNGKQSNKPMKITRSVGLQVLPPGNRPGIVRGRRPPGPSGRPVNTTPAASPSPVRTPVQRPTATSPRQSVQQPIKPRPVPQAVAVRPVQVNNIIRKLPQAPAPEVVNLDDDDVVPIARPMQHVVRPLVGLQQAKRIHPQNLPRGFAPRAMVTPRPRHLLTLRHPAPLPNGPPVAFNPQLKNIPPKPTLKINKGRDGVVLSWNMVLDLLDHATVASYQIYAYQETANQKPDPSLWKKVGQVNALPLPMACTLKQFAQGNKYHFSVRACDTHQRQGIFSDPASIQI